MRPTRRPRCLDLGACDVARHLEQVRRELGRGVDPVVDLPDRSEPIGSAVEPRVGRIGQLRSHPLSSTVRRKSALQQRFHGDEDDFPQRA